MLLQLLDLKTIKRVDDYIDFGVVATSERYIPERLYHTHKTIASFGIRNPIFFFYFLACQIGTKNEPSEKVMF